MFRSTVSAIDNTIDQIKHPGMNRTSVRRPGRFVNRNIATHLPARPHPKRREQNQSPDVAFPRVATILRLRAQPAST
jgi:hypothetical protein